MWFTGLRFWPNSAFMVKLKGEDSCPKTSLGGMCVHSERLSQANSLDLRKTLARILQWSEYLYLSEPQIES